MESSKGGVVGESRRELLGSDTIADARQPSWRLNLDEFRLPERESDHGNPTFNIRRLIRHKSMSFFVFVRRFIVNSRIFFLSREPCESKLLV